MKLVSDIFYPELLLVFVYHRLGRLPQNVFIHSLPLPRGKFVSICVSVVGPDVNSVVEGMGVVKMLLNNCKNRWMDALFFDIFSDIC